jgi:tetratricopeptide (TPR) repeat protein
MGRHRVPLFITGVALVVVFARPLYLFTVETYETLMLQLYPSAARASMYGARHLDAQYPLFYDISAADYFYNQAALYDPKYPYVAHQLARIAFLRGQLVRALAEIDWEIEQHGDTEPNTYYIRGLIEGYMGKYDDAIKDYQHFLDSDPHNWATMNDLTWVLLKANRPKEAVDMTERGLKDFPDNPWLLNNSAIALHETGEDSKALERAQKAVLAANSITEAEWLHAYPGNNPVTASEGIATLQKSAEDNLRAIQAVIASSTAKKAK